MSISSGRDEDYYSGNYSDEHKIEYALITNNFDKIKQLAPGSLQTVLVLLARVMGAESIYLQDKWADLLFGQSKKENVPEYDPSHQEGENSFRYITQDSIKNQKDELMNYIKELNTILAYGKQNALCFALMGYISSITGDNLAAEKYFDECEKLGPDSLLKGQLHLFRTLNEFYKSKSELSPGLQKICIQDMAWLDSLPVDRHNSELRRNFFVLLAGKFYLSGDFVRTAACFDAIQDNSIGKFLIDTVASPEQISNMEDFLAGKESQPLDQYLLKNFCYSRGDMEYLQALKYLRKENLKAAYEAIKDAQGACMVKNTLLSTDTASLPRPRQVVSTRDAIKQMYELSLPQKDKEKQAKNFYELGSIYFSCPHINRSYTGKYKWGWMNLDKMGNFFPGIKGEYQDYDSRDNAIIYIKKALALTTNKELMAKCDMILLLDNNKKSNYGQQEIQQNDTSYAAKYSGTDFYRKYINSCSVMSQIIALPTPTAAAGEVVSPFAAVKISAGQYKSFALDAEGNLWISGSFRTAQNGTQDNTQGSITFHKIMGSVKNISVSRTSTFILENNGTVLSDWKISGISKTRSSVENNTFNQMLTDVKSISGNMAIKNDNSLWILNNDFFYMRRPGQENKGDNNYFAQSLTDVSTAAEGYGDLYFAIKKDGSLWAKGKNRYGGFGKVDNNNGDTWTQIMTDTEAVVSGNHTLILKYDGTLWAAGHNNAGQLGTGDRYERDTFVKVLSGVASMAVGGWHSLALKTDGSLWAAGNNNHGQLGTGDVENSNNFKHVLDDVTSIAADTNFSLAIKNDGSVWATGDNAYGQLGTNDILRKLTWTQIYLWKNEGK
jgi:alpha-tubulin suppressor-like RCC1 family protein